MLPTRPCMLVTTVSLQEPIYRQLLTPQWMVFSTTSWREPHRSRSVLYQYTPPTPARLNCRVASRRRCVHEFATSSGRLPTDLVDNLETGQTDSIAVWLREFWSILINQGEGDFFWLKLYLRIPYTPPTRLNSTVESRRRRRCVLGLYCLRCWTDPERVRKRYERCSFLLLPDFQFPKALEIRSRS